jgi:hypothetical protein
MSTIYFLTPARKHSKTFVCNHFIHQEFKQQKTNSVLTDNELEDDFLDGDFTKNLIISVLNNWSKQHLNSFPIRTKKQYCPPAN